MRSARALVALSLAMVVVALVGGCIGTEIEDYPCPPEGTNLTYESFGKGFFASHCVECHGGGHGHSSTSYTTIESIRRDKDRIFINAAADNTYMPPGPDDPDENQREALAEWLACGAP